MACQMKYVFEDACNDLQLIEEVHESHDMTVWKEGMVSSNRWGWESKCRMCDGSEKIGDTTGTRWQHKKLSKQCPAHISEEY